MDPETQQQPLIERKYEQYFTPQKTTNNDDNGSLQQPLQGEIVDSVTTYGVYETPITFDK